MLTSMITLKAVHYRVLPMSMMIQNYLRNTLNSMKLMKRLYFLQHLPLMKMVVMVH